MKRTLFVIVALLAVLVMPAAAQSDITPSVTVSDQFVTHQVYIENVDSAVQGFVVIHIQADGAPGPVAGFAPVNPGSNPGVWIPIDTTIATPVLYAMLHVDDGTVGEYEFDGASGLDNPVSVDGAVVTPAFNVAIIHAEPQVVTDSSVTIGAVTIPVDGWVVIHSDLNGGPGPVLGQTQVSAGTTTDVAVPLSGTTNTLWPMLHVDDGAIGTYEFDGASGLDNPVVIGGSVAVTPFSTVPSINATAQAILAGDGREAGDMTFVAAHVLSEGPGFLVIHSDADGGPGPVLGFTAVEDGTTENVEVALTGDVTPVVWPMLHVDDGTLGEYEFDGASGLDNPVSVDDQVVTFPVSIAPSMVLSDQEFANGQVVVDQVIMDVPGWVVIHSNFENNPGPVLGQTLVPAGVSNNVAVTVDPAEVGTQVFPMLHVDDGAIGVYEFDGQSGLDAPIAFGGAVVVAPLAVTGADAAAAAAQPAGGLATLCSVSPLSGTINVRANASTDSTVLMTLAAGATADVDGQTTSGAYVWYHLTTGGWVRGDIVTATGDCGAVAAMADDAAATTTTDTTAATTVPAPEPAETPES